MKSVKDWILFANDHKDCPSFIHGKSVLEMCRQSVRYKTSKRFEFSVLEYSPDYGFCEFVYSYKYTKRKGEEIMLFLAFSEKEGFPPLARNCYKTNFGLVIYGHYGESRGNSWSYAQYESDLEEACDWVRTIFYSPTATLEDIIAADPTLKYCGYPGTTSPTTWIARYRKHPIYEMLGKLKLYNLDKKVIAKMETDKAFRKYICRYRDELIECSIGWVISAYKKGENPRLYYQNRVKKSQRSRLYKYLEEDVRQELEQFWTPDDIMDYMDKLISRKVLLSYNAVYTLFDYYRALSLLHVDFKNSRITFPKPEEFLQKHDEAVSLRKEVETKQLKEGILKCASLYSGLEQSFRGFCFILAKSQSELESEGTALNHCVGRMGYGAKMAAQKTMIVFCRHADDLSTPFATIEVSIPGLKIIQCHGLKNRAEPEVEEAFTRVLEKYKKQQRKSA